MIGWTGGAFGQVWMLGVIPADILMFKLVREQKVRDVMWKKKKV